MPELLTHNDMWMYKVASAYAEGASIRSLAKDLAITQKQALWAVRHAVGDFNSLGDEVDETKILEAQKSWDGTWMDRIPRSGTGTYAYHHHFVGLDSDEAKLEKDALPPSTDVHSDLWLSGNSKTYGFTVFPRGQDLGGDSFFSKTGSLQAQPKLASISQWLSLDEPLTTDPGNNREQTGKHTKVFPLAKGTYRVGVCTRDQTELFFTSGEMQGRALVKFDTSQRTWEISRPEDQTPLNESMSLLDALTSVKKRQQNGLVWVAKSGSVHFISGKQIESLYTSLHSGDNEIVTLKLLEGLPNGISSINDDGDETEIEVVESETIYRTIDQQYTFGVLYKAGDFENIKYDDAHKEFTSAEELQKAVWDYVDSGDRSLFVQHGFVPGIGYRKAGRWVEIVTWPTNVTLATEVEGRTVRKNYPAGTAFMGAIWDDWAWPLIKSGQLTGFSFGGRTKRRPVGHLG